jgi:hypothetical protein
VFTDLVLLWCAASSSLRHYAPHVGPHLSAGRLGRGCAGLPARARRGIV